MVLMKALDFVRVYYNADNSITCLLMGKKSLTLMSTINMLIFQLNFVSEVYLMD